MRVFDLNKLRLLDKPDTRDKAIDHLMNYWDTEFTDGRFDEFQDFVDHAEWDLYSPEVVVCISTIGWWVKEKFNFQPFVERIKKYYVDHGFSEERIKILMKGLDH